MRGVRFVEKENAHEHDQHHEEVRQHEFWLAQAPVIQVDHGKHGHETESQPEELPQQKVVTVSVLLASRQSRGAKNHHRADQAERDRGDEQPAVRFGSSQHGSDLAPARVHRTRRFGQRAH